MMAFLFIGENLLHLIGIDVQSFSMAGAIVIFLLALEMILNIELFKANSDDQSAASIVPIAFPLIVGTVRIGNYILQNFTSWAIRLTFDPTIWIWLTALSVVITILGSYRAISSILK